MRGVIAYGVVALLFVAQVTSLGIVAAPVSAAGTTYVVDAAGGGDFQTIQAALDATVDGDTVEVNPGVYRERVVVDTNVTLVAPSGATLNGSTFGSASTGITVDPALSTGLLVEGFTVERYGDGITVGGSAGESYDEASETAIAGGWTIRDVTVQNNAEDGIDVADTSTAWTLLRVTARRNGDDGIEAGRYAGTGAWTIRASNASENQNAGIYVGQSTANWQILDSTTNGNENGVYILHDGNAWTIGNHTARYNGHYGINPAGSFSGDWTVHNATIANNSGSGIGNGAGLTGNWTIRDSLVASNYDSGIYVPSATGDFRIENVSVVENSRDGIWATDTTGNWRIDDSTVENNGDFRGYYGIAAEYTEGAWVVDNSSITGNVNGGINATKGATDRPVGDATGNWWGQSGGPLAGQCVGYVDCSSPLSAQPGTNTGGSATDVNVSVDVTVGLAQDCPDPSNVSGCVATADRVTASPGDRLVVTHTLENTGTANVTTQTLESEALGTVLDNASVTIAPGERYTVSREQTARTQMSTIRYDVNWTATTDDDRTARSNDSYVVVVPAPTVELDVRVGLAQDCPDPSDVRTCVATTDSVVASPGDELVVNYILNNIGEINVTEHTLTDGRGGLVYDGEIRTIEPGETLVVTRTETARTQMSTISYEPEWEAGNPGSSFRNSTDSYQVVVPAPNVELNVSVGLAQNCPDPSDVSSCVATTDSVVASPDDRLVVTYNLTNTGDIDVTNHTLTDGRGGYVYDGANFTLEPGESRVFSTVETARTQMSTLSYDPEWTAGNTGSSFRNSTDSYQVVVPAPDVELDVRVDLAQDCPDPSDVRTCVATNDSVVASPGDELVVTYVLNNVGDIDVTEHTLTDGRGGLVYDGELRTIEPGETLVVSRAETARTQMSTLTYDPEWSAGNPGSSFRNSTDAYEVVVPAPNVELDVRVGLAQDCPDPSDVTTCVASGDSVRASPGDELVVNYILNNVGEINVTEHTLTDGRGGFVYDGEIRTIEPGGTLVVTRTETARTQMSTITYDPEWTAGNPGSSSRTSTDSYQVIVPAPDVELNATTDLRTSCSDPTNATTCQASAEELVVGPGTEFVLTATLQNVGDVNVTAHTVVGTGVGSFSTDGNFTVKPGETARVNAQGVAPTVDGVYDYNVTWNASNVASEDEVSDTYTLVVANASRVQSQTVNGTYAATVTDPGASEPTTLLPGENTTVDTRLDATTITTSNNATYNISVSGSPTPPGGTPSLGLEANGVDLGYLTLEHSVPDSAIENVTFRFRVSRSGLDATGQTPGDVVLYRYVDGSPVPLRTTLARTTADWYVFEATSPGLSVFAVGAGDLQSATDSDPAEENTDSGTSHDTDDDSDGDSGRSSSGGSSDSDTTPTPTVTATPIPTPEASSTATPESTPTEPVESTPTPQDDEAAVTTTSQDGGAEPTTETGAPGFTALGALGALFVAGLLARRRS